MTQCEICEQNTRKRKNLKIKCLVGHIKNTMFHFKGFWCWDCFEANVIEVLKDDPEDVKNAKYFWNKFYPLE